MLLPVRLYELSIIDKCKQNINELSLFCKSIHYVICLYKNSFNAKRTLPSYPVTLSA